eukprot:9495663-Pyramimonas_sp.AAC.1
MEGVWRECGGGPERVWEQWECVQAGLGAPVERSQWRGVSGETEKRRDFCDDAECAQRGMDNAQGQERRVANTRTDDKGGLDKVSTPISGELQREVVAIVKELLPAVPLRHIPAGDRFASGA